MEAENYLSTGYGLRLAIEERPSGWKPFSQVARVWQPSRLKGIQVGPDFGTPFFSATQVFDHRPVPRKWLALARTDSSQDRFVSPGTILVTCSGAVGRSLLGYEAHTGALISHDLLRVEANEPEQWGWIYAYLRSPQARAMMSGAQYGHIIKHLETSHLDALPIPILRHGLATDLHQKTQAILDCRNRVHRLTREAEERFASAVGPIKETGKEDGFEVRASSLFSGRRRFEASFHAPAPAAILRRFKALKASVMPLYQVAERVWWMTRFRRFYGEDGIPYLSADELFTINPPDAKRILVEPSDDHKSYFVKRGWIVMACSGQIYGLNGAACLMTEDHEGVFFSHDLIRIIPQDDVIRAGYLLTALTHPVLGRPLLIRAAYGTSIPHLDPGDVSNFPVVRLSEPEEAAIADLAEQAASERARADALDRTLADNAGRLIERFLAGDMEAFVAIHLKDRL
jgi:type I restriction enzyme, S subunit